MSQTKEKLNGFNVFTMAYGGTIGSGVFVLMAIAMMYTGKSLPLAVIVAMAYMTMAMLYQLVIVSFVPLKGGFYSQFYMVLPPTLIGILSVGQLAMGLTYSMYGLNAIVYLASVIQPIAPYTKTLGIAVLVIAYILSAFDAKSISKVQDFMTIVMIAALAAFIGCGIAKVDFSSLSPFVDGFFLGGGNGFISASALMGYACMGASLTTVSLAQVTKDARHTIPKFTLIASVAVMLTYVLMAVVAVGVLPIEQVAGQTLSVVAEVIFNSLFFKLFIIGGAVFALLTSLCSGLVMLRYGLEAVAKDNWFPSVMNRTLKNGYPVVLMAINLVLGFVAIIFDLSMDDLVSLLQIPNAPLYLVATFACFSLPKKYPNLWKKNFFHMPMPLFYGLMGLCVAACGYYLYSYVITLSTQFYIAGGVYIVLMYLYCYWRVKSGAVDKEGFERKRDEAIQQVLEAESMEVSA